MPWLPCLSQASLAGRLPVRREPVDLREQAQAALHHFVASRPIERPLELRVQVGHPVEQILDVVTRDHVDLIVMGTHGRTGLAHAVMGSVAERVVRLSPCPVLTVKKAAEE